METAIYTCITRAAGLGEFWHIPGDSMSSSQNQYNSGSSSRSTPVVPPAAATSATKVKSEQDCFELLALEFASLPDREMPEADAAAVQQQQQQLTAAAASAATPDTPTNRLIARTIRAAMADIKPTR